MLWRFLPSKLLYGLTPSLINWRSGVRGPEATSEQNLRCGVYYKFTRKGKGNPPLICFPHSALLHMAFQNLHFHLIILIISSSSVITLPIWLPRRLITDEKLDFSPCQRLPSGTLWPGSKTSQNHFMDASLASPSLWSSMILHQDSCLLPRRYVHLLVATQTGFTNPDLWTFGLFSSEPHTS